jgi:hypothetical protein
VYKNRYRPLTRCFLPKPNTCGYRYSRQRAVLAGVREDTLLSCGEAGAVFSCWSGHGVSSYGAQARRATCIPKTKKRDACSTRHRERTTYAPGMHTANRGRRTTTASWHMWLSSSSFSLLPPLSSSPTPVSQRILGSSRPRKTAV